MDIHWALDLQIGTFMYTGIGYTSITFTFLKC